MSVFIWYCFPRTGNPLTRLGPQICSIQNCHIVVIVSVYIFCISLKYLEILSADTDSLLFFTNQQWLSLRWYQIFTSCCCGLSIWRKIQQLCKCMFLIVCFFHFSGKKGYTPAPIQVKNWKKKFKIFIGWDGNAEDKGWKLK